MTNDICEKHDEITKTQVENTRETVREIRWLTHIIGVALLIVFIKVLQIEFSNLFLLPRLADKIYSIVLLTMMLALIISWKWEGLGGLLLIGSFITMGILIKFFQIDVKYRELFTYLGPYLITGILYFYCWLKTLQLKKYKKIESQNADT